MLRRSLLVLAATALALGLAACGGVQQTLGPVALAADRSASAGGSVTMHLDASISVAGESASFTADGVFDDDAGKVTLDLGELVSQASAGAIDGEVTVITTKEDDHCVVYLQLPQLAGLSIPGGKSWMKLDVDQALAGTGLGAAGSGLFGASQNPADALELLKQVAEVTEVGSETVDGVETTHYSATVDLEDALAQAGVPAEAMEPLEASGLETAVPLDVWVGDDDGYVRRVKVSYAATAMGQTVSADVTMTMSDWGADVSIDVPDDDEVYDASKLVSGLANLTRS